MPLTGPPVPPPPALRPRVDTHLQPLGILWCVYAGYRVLHGILGMVIMHTFLSNFHDWGDSWLGTTIHHGWMTPFLPLLGLFTILWAGLAAFTGYALLTRQPWGRTLAIVVAILSLIKIPVGTALGIYTLWVLAPAPSDVEYQVLADKR
jgi:hypothetical protein